jgi:sec-independent protein translocase protein TatC
VADDEFATFFSTVSESLDITLKFIMAFGMCFQLPARC